MAAIVSDRYWFVASRVSWGAFVDAVREFPLSMKPEELCEHDAEAFENAAAEIRRKLAELDGGAS